MAMRSDPWKTGAISEEERAERDKGAEPGLTGYTSGRIREEENEEEPEAQP